VLVLDRKEMSVLLASIENYIYFMGDDERNGILQVIADKLRIIVRQRAIDKSILTTEQL
jgi:hypothetical protein